MGPTAAGRRVAPPAAVAAGASVSQVVECNLDVQTLKVRLFGLIVIKLYSTFSGPCPHSLRGVKIYCWGSADWHCWRFLATAFPASSKVV